MVEGGAEKLVKYLLFAVTFLIFVGGIIVFAVGIWASVQKIKPVEVTLSDESYTYATYVFIGTGLAIALLSCLGCCGALRESKLKLGLFFVVLFVVFIILLAGGIMGFLFRNKVETELEKKMEVSLKKYGGKGNEPYTDGWDNMQVYFECCGVSGNGTKGYQVWEMNENLKNQSKKVPDSCCKDKDKIDACQKDPEAYVFDKDCVYVIQNYLKTNAKILGAIGVAVALCLVIGMILTCFLYQVINKSREKRRNHR